MTAHPPRKNKNPTSSYLILQLLGLILALTSCRSPLPTGTLYVQSKFPGTYEVYKIDSEFPFQYTSEKIGNFNEQMQLNPGQYLILADCSSETRIIRPGQETKLVVHHIQFSTPSPPKPGDQFSIQCDRYSETQSRQSHQGTYALNILPGYRDILVGMVPLKIRAASLLNSASPKSIQYQLSSVMIESLEKIPSGTRYFISPKEALIALTTDQEFGQKQFLLPGNYIVEVNGTRSLISLKPGEEKTIAPAFLKISVAPKTDLSLSQKVRGIPLFGILNDNHHIDLNETYPVMPGKAEVRLTNSKEVKIITLVEKQLTELNLRTVLVRSNCSPWDFTCIGRIKVFIHTTDKSYPIATGVTDVPIIFFADKASVSLQGTKDIKHTIADSVSSQEFHIGSANFVPRHLHNVTWHTDLVRIEAGGEKSTGNSLDLSLTTSERVFLITGRYSLGQYSSNINPDIDRNQKTTIFSVYPNFETNIKFTVYTSDPKLLTTPQQHVKKNQTDFLNSNGSQHQIISGKIF